MLAKPNIVIAKRLLSLGLEDAHLSPIAGTPIEALTAASLPVAAAPTGEVVDVVHEASMHQNVGGIVEHDMVAEEVVPVLAEAIRGHFSFARNVVKTAINSTVAAIEDAEANTGMPNYSIVSVRPAEVLLSPTIEDLIGRYATERTEPFALGKNFPKVEIVKLTEMLRTGHADFDNQVADLVAGHDVDWLLDLWETFFQQGAQWEPSYNLKAADAYLVVHLWTMHLIDNVVSVDGYSLEEYKLLIATTMAATGGALVLILSNHDNYESAGVVVLEYPNRLPFLRQVEDGEIRVYGPSYDRFLAAGGSPEIIFGAAVSDRPINQEQLLANKERYASAYLTTYETAVNMFNAKRSERLWILIGVEVSKYVQSCPKEHLNPEYANPVEDTQAAVKQYIANLSDVVIGNNCYQFVRDVFGKAVFGHSNALDILTGIDARQAVNPNESLMDSAYHVAVDLIVEYQLSQVQVTRL